MFTAKRVVVIGLDAPITKSILKYSEKGKLPNITKLIKNGVYAENCLVPYPTITPPNWTTIVTGAWPGTHGITCINMHKPSWPLNYTPPAFTSLDCEAEYIWQAAEKARKRTILLNYPSTWPPREKSLIQVGGASVFMNEWMVDREEQRRIGKFTIADEQLISTEEYPLADVVKLKEAEGWKDLPDGKHLEAEVRLGYRKNYDKVQPVEGFILVQGSEGKGYDRVSFALEKDSRKILFTLKEGEWSEKQLLTFETNRGEKRSVFKAKLIELSLDGNKLRLYFTPFCQLDGWSHPPETAENLENISGLPGRTAYMAHALGWVDSETWLETMREENTWLGEAAAYLLKNYDWTLFFMHAHAPDAFYHYAINRIDPEVCKDETVVEEYSRIEEGMYISLDEMIGRIIDAVDEKTIVFIVSDHGAVPTERLYGYDREGRITRGVFTVSPVLVEAGLLTYKTDEKAGESIELYGSPKVINWSRTKAVPQRSVYIYVNLKGREPRGIVEPEDYDRVRDEIINALYNYTDPKTGKKPIVFAFKKEDARILGLYGDRIGDVVYGLRADVPAEHGRQMTTGEYGVGSLKGLLIMAGPNIKKDYVLKRTVRLTDIVPTICYLLGLPTPKDAEGAIIYQSLENPDYLIEELENLKRNYNRLKAVYDVDRSIIHDYEHM